MAAAGGGMAGCGRTGCGDGDRVYRRLELNTGDAVKLETDVARRVGVVGGFIADAGAPAVVFPAKRLLALGDRLAIGAYTVAWGVRGAEGAFAVAGSVTFVGSKARSDIITSPTESTDVVFVSGRFAFWRFVAGSSRKEVECLAVADCESVLLAVAASVAVGNDRFRLRPCVSILLLLFSSLIRKSAPPRYSYEYICTALL